MNGSIEVGVTYVTRNGSLVTIEHDKGDTLYPFFGMVISGTEEVNRIAYFTHSGQYSIGRETPFDIAKRANVQP